MPDDYYAIRFRLKLKTKSQHARKVLFGIITESVVKEPGKTGNLVIKCSDGSVIDDEFEIEWDLVESVGMLVLVEESDDSIVLDRI